MSDYAKNIIEQMTPDVQEYVYQLMRSYEDLEQQIDQLTNNWNELEEWINRNCFYDDDTLTYEELINKMEEIKEGNNVSSRD